jgi:hypothetical protein
MDLANGLLFFMPFSQLGGSTSLLVLEKVLGLSQVYLRRTFQLPSGAAIPHRLLFPQTLAYSTSICYSATLVTESDAWVRTLTERFDFSCFVMLLSDWHPT